MIEAFSKVVNIDALDIKATAPTVTSLTVSRILEVAFKLRALTIHNWSDLNRSVTNIIAKSRQLEQLTIYNCGLAKNPLTFILAGKQHGFKLELVHSFKQGNQTVLKL